MVPYSADRIGSDTQERRCSSFTPSDICGNSCEAADQAGSPVPEMTSRYCADDDRILPKNRKRIIANGSIKIDVLACWYRRRGFSDDRREGADEFWYPVQNQLQLLQG